MCAQLTDERLIDQFAALGFVTCSRALLNVLRLSQKAASVSDITVLIEGETGTGKQVLAHSIHRLDEKRKAHPFITVHCGTISESLAESELFGHERGAFSGAVSLRKGLFRSADGGTLFLDDINDLSPNLQPKLLDCLQRNVIRPVGSDREIHVDVRIIAASNRPLAPLVRENLFRADLYHRLNVVKLSLPPLRERREDLPALVLTCARRHSHIYSRILSVETDLIQFLERQEFPGNVRELEHGVERALFSKVQGTSLALSDWTAQPEAGDQRDWIHDAASSLSNAMVQRGLPYVQAFRQLERAFLEIIIGSGGRTRREIAAHLKTSERTLYHKLRSHGISHRSPAP